MGWKGSARPAGLAVAVACALAGAAEATWSIVAVDPETREVGVAGASCILDADVIAILVPGQGAAVAQAYTNPDGRVRLRKEIEQGRSAQGAIDAVTTRLFDSFLAAPLYQLRQYGVVTLTEGDAPAHFTGRWTIDHAGGRTGPNVSVQGNTLHGPEVLDEALAAFLHTPAGCRPRLAERLLAAVVAGGEAGGDKRCVPELAALSAFLQVAAPGDPPDAPSLSLEAQRPGEPPWNPWREIQNGIRPAPGTREENPVLLLAAAFDRQRAADPGSGPRCYGP
jgi:uncharacterized Ntn-hydrolase superfamily protein